MAYCESDCNLCKSCYVKIRKPSKKVIKKIVLTTYEDQCDNCSKFGRLVDLIWDEEEEDD